MRPEQLQELKVVIEGEVKMTEAAIADYKDMAQPVAPDDLIGRISRMDAIMTTAIVI